MGPVRAICSKAFHPIALSRGDDCLSGGDFAVTPQREHPVASCLSVQAGGKSPPQRAVLQRRQRATEAPVVLAGRPEQVVFTIRPERYRSVASMGRALIATPTGTEAFANSKTVARQDRYAVPKK